MLARRGEIDMVVVPDQGHAPLLEEPKLMRRIAAFVASCDVSDGRAQSFSRPTDWPQLVPEICSDGMQEDFKPELGPRVSVPSTATLGARSVAHVVIGEPAPSLDHVVGI